MRSFTEKKEKGKEKIILKEIIMIQKLWVANIFKILIEKGLDL